MSLPWLTTQSSGEDHDERPTGQCPGNPKSADPAEGTAVRRATGGTPAVHAQLRQRGGRPRRGRDLRTQDRSGGQGVPAEREPLRRRDRGPTDLDGVAAPLAAVLSAWLAERHSRVRASPARPSLARQNLVPSLHCRYSASCEDASMV